MTGTIEALNRFADQWWWPTVVHGGWQSAAVALLVLTSVGLARRWPAPLRSALVVVALAKFLCPPLLSLPSGIFSHLRPEAVPAAVKAGVTVAEAVEPAVRFAPADGTTGPSPGGGTAPTTSEAVARRTATRGPAGDVAVSRAVPHEELASAVERRPGPALHGTAALMLVHALGTLGLLGWIGWQTWRLRRLVAAGSPCERADVARWVDERSRQLGLRRPVRLLVSDTADSPMAFGVWRPTVLLPGDVLTLSRRDLETVLVHELAHLRRRDAWLNWLQAVVCAVWWFHPLAWISAATARRLREDCCDDLLLLSGVTGSDDYCDTLLRIAGHGRRRATAGIACAMADRLHPLAGRLRRIMDGRVRRSAGLSSAGVIGVTLAACLLLPGFSRGSAAEGDPEPSPNVQRPARAGASSGASDDGPADAPKENETPSDRAQPDRGRPAAKRGKTAPVDTGPRGFLSGPWRMSLPAGFEHRVTFQPVDRRAGRYRLDVGGKKVVLEGVYQIDEDALVVVDPDDHRMTGFVWRVDGDGGLRLVRQRLPSPNGANYVGATLKRLDTDRELSAQDQVRP